MQSIVLHTLLKQQPTAQEWSGQGMLQASEGWEMHKEFSLEELEENVTLTGCTLTGV
jgi:hypothetical protein